MEEKRIKSLAEFFANMHISNKDKIQSKPALEKYTKIMNSPTSKRLCEINYSNENKATLIRNLGNFFRAPGDKSAMLLLEVDEKHDWIKLIRFVAKGAENLNAETISLSGKGVQGFNGFGFRYEHPEDKGDEHNFFHVQPISETVDGAKIPGIPNWFSHRFPTFYMHADDSFELVIYAISSLCGWRVLQKYQQSAHDDCWLLKHLISKGSEAWARDNPKT
ncbi:hypothetical protein HBO40_18365 [Pseudomonas protegens]|uniref:hypothetical protein n=1 Tax=Pseudomonas protegens TaxID=380021 RepID=UPI0014740D13|nr:hypothetical protein [Pseudomonas protegens]NMZ29608.1 hypothetical protein [Pseudomonas protegens]NMZ86652.1 hypothetical protein [Pseudomonas protegens]